MLFANANDSLPRFELGTIAVTGSFAGTDISEQAKHVSVITHEDIDRSSANTVVELISAESGVQLRSFFGNGKNDGIDIRGSGQTFVSNVLVLVNGFRVNSPDLAGADFTQISLDNIQRIEVIRGNNTVRFGDGAVNGVINIVTKTSAQKQSTNVNLFSGSYKTRKGSIYISQPFGVFNSSVNASRSITDGYRSNGFLNSHNFEFNLTTDQKRNSAVSIAYLFHKDHYGLPGSVLYKDAYERDLRTSTTAPDDFGRTTSSQLQFNFIHQIKGSIRLNIDAFKRNRDNRYITGYSALLSEDSQFRKINEDTSGVDASITIPFGIQENKNKLNLGFHYQKTDYITDRKPELEYILGNFKDRGIFAESQFTLDKNLTFLAGFRYEQRTGEFRKDTYQMTFGPFPAFVPLGLVRIAGNNKQRNWTNHANSLGLNWRYNDSLSLFSNYSHSFRNPNVDEMALAANDLRPQDGKEFEAGIRFEGDIIELNTTLFNISTRNEILFDQAANLNKNSTENTQRTGIEFDVKTYPSDNIFLSANYSYIHATFKDSGHVIPLVARHKADLHLEWDISDTLLFTMDNSWVGTRQDGNYINNPTNPHRLESYTVSNIKLTTDQKSYSVSVGINNMLNTLYLSNQFSDGTYPMPERNLYASLKWKIN